MPDFSRVIHLAYQRILGRPADPGGLESYNRHMNFGMTEAEMRESLLRSPEYAQKHPDLAALSARASVATRKKSRKSRNGPKRTRR